VFFSVLGTDLESSTAARCSARFFICRCSGLWLVSSASLPQLGQRASGFFDLTSILVPLVLFDFVSRCRVLAVAACSWSHVIFPCPRFCGHHRSEIRCAPAIRLVTGQILSRSVLQGISSLGFSPALECQRVPLCSQLNGFVPAGRIVLRLFCGLLRVVMRTGAVITQP
jgi:hypothetical protein